ncbi:MAG: S1 RNA-binding domain-containing protein [Clostridia bacterium]|nr:S1 RNA-binding domain-containing protein [Clostridia bacterium]
MDIVVGNIYEGKVTGITKFGAFVQLAPGKSGMVHISEITNSFVSDISQHLSDGQIVKVKVIGIDQANRINLSIKKAVEQQQPPRTAAAPQRPRQAAPKEEEDPFETKLKAFMQSSESRISDLKSQNDRRSGGKRRR